MAQNTLFVFDVEGTITDRFSGNRAFPHVVKWMKDHPNANVAFVANSGGVGYRVAKEMEGWTNLEKYPTQIEAEARMETLRYSACVDEDNTLFRAPESIFSIQCFVYVDRWGKAAFHRPGGGDPRWGVEYRLPNVGMIEAAVAHFGQPDRIVLVAENDRNGLAMAYRKLHGPVAFYTAEQFFGQWNQPEFSGLQVVGENRPAPAGDEMPAEWIGKAYEPGSAFEAMVEKAREFATHFHDYTVPRADVQFDDEGKLGIPGRVEGLGLTTYSHGQLCQRLDIPAGYSNRCPGHIQATNFNHWLHHGKTAYGKTPGDFLIRGYGDTVRAVLSDQYVPLSNVWILETVLDMLPKGPGGLDGLKLIRPFMGPDAFHLRVMFADEPGGNYGVGFYVRHGEIGNYQLEIGRFIQRHSCENSVVRSDVYKHQHRAITVALLKGEIKEHIGRAIEMAPAMLEETVEAETVAIPNLNDVISGVVKKFKLNDNVQAEILKGTEAKNTRMGFVNGLSFAAHSTPGLDQDTRIQLETMAGDALAGELFGQKIKEPALVVATS